MSWRKPTEYDLVATLSQDEVEAYRASGGISSDPVELILARTVEMVRGKCLTNPAVKVCPEEGTIPGSLIAAAMDFAAYDILCRFPAGVNDDRRKKRDWAAAEFDKVASGQLAVESYDAASADARPSGSPLAAPTLPPHLLD